MSTAAPQSPTSARSDDGDEVVGGGPRAARGRRSFSQQFAWWVRWLHIYLSMLSFAALLFFAVTGLTLNHPDWFGASAASTRAAEGTLPAGLVPASGEAGIRQLELVEFLRSEHAIRGALVELRADDVECTIAFKGPGYTADVTIDRRAGSYELSESRFGLAAVLNDLHKGRDTGGGWSVFIDVSAIIMAVVSASGLVLLFYLKRRLMTGLVTAAAGGLLVYLLYALLVP